MSNARHTSPPSLSPSPLLDSDAVMASPSAICKALSISSCLAIRGQSAVREPGCTTQGGGTTATHIARLLSAMHCGRGTVQSVVNAVGTSQEFPIVLQRKVEGRGEEGEAALGET